MSSSLWPHGLQHARLPCPSLSPGVYSNSCPLSEWCHPTISSFVVPITSHLQSFPASGSFPLSWLFASEGQRTGASASVSVLPVNIQGWFPLGLTVLISFESKGLSRVFHSDFRSFSSVQFSCSVLSDSLRPHESQHARPPCPSPTPGVTQTHVHRVSDAIQPSHPLSSPSPPAPSPSQHQSLFQWVNTLHEVAKVLEFQL